MLDAALPFVAVLRPRLPDAAHGAEPPTGRLLRFLRAGLFAHGFHLTPEGIIEHSDPGQRRVPIGDYAMLPRSTLALWAEQNHRPALLTGEGGPGGPACPFLAPIAGALAFSLWAPALDVAARDALALLLLRLGQGALHRLTDGRAVCAAQLRRVPLAEALAPGAFARGAALLRRDPGPYLDQLATRIEQALRAEGVMPPGAELAWRDGRLQVIADGIPLPPPRTTGTVSLWLYGPEAQRPAVAGRLLAAPTLEALTARA